MKKFPVLLITCLFLFGALFVSGCFSETKELDDLFPIGTKVVIGEDIRHLPKDKLATGKEALFVGYAKEEAWVLYDKEGECLKESKTLSEGFVEWKPETESFPGQKYGISSSNPIFVLEDGSQITGRQCYWDVVDTSLRKKMMDEFKKEQEKRMKKIEKYYENMADTPK